MVPFFTLTVGAPEVAPVEVALALALAEVALELLATAELAL